MPDLVVVDCEQTGPDLVVQLVHPELESLLEGALALEILDIKLGRLVGARPELELLVVFRYKLAVAWYKVGTPWF